MNKIRLTGLIAAALATGAVTLTACDSSDSSSTPSPTASMMSSVPMAAAPNSMMGTMAPAGMARTGTFSGLNGKHVSGTATIEGNQLVLTGFSSDEGPDLHAYLTNGTDEMAVSAGKEINAVSYDAASQTFTLQGVDTAMYHDVVIHCDKAKAVFGAATLS